MITEYGKDWITRYIPVDSPFDAPTEDWKLNLPIDPQLDWDYYGKVCYQIAHYDLLPVSTAQDVVQKLRRVNLNLEVISAFFIRDTFMMTVKTAVERPFYTICAAHIVQQYPGVSVEDIDVDRDHGLTIYTFDLVWRPVVLDTWKRDRSWYAVKGIKLLRHGMAAYGYGLDMRRAYRRADGRARQLLKQGSE